jgi:hypothetical protein
MARPKGVIQKRNESKYWLPLGITLKDGQTDIYNKETKLIFIDPLLGEFISYFKALQWANASTHPKAVQTRREATNLTLYGGSNPSNSKEIREKAHNTMQKKYGVRHALQNKDLLIKSRETLKTNYNADNPMDLESVKLKIRETCMREYGSENPMQNEKIVNALKLQFMEKYGVDNPAKYALFQEKALKSMIRSGGIRGSKGEDEVREYVQSLGLKADNGYIGGANPKQIDIKISELNIGIEYNGIYWHSEDRIETNYHRDKTLAAKEQGLNLIQIFDFEWNNRREQVKSFLKSALGKNEIKIFGRNTEVREIIDKTIARDFLEKYHILGSTHFIKAFGLYYENDLVSLITIGKHHRNNEEYVLSRFVGKYNVNVLGGLSKLVSRAISEYGELTTWIDLRFSNGDKWIKAGWEQISTLPPDYFYYNSKNNVIISKQSRKKSIVNTPVEMTEREHAKLDGLKRVYDCGKIKLKINKKVT